MGVNRLITSTSRNVGTKELRKRSTDAEKLLWKYLRSEQLEGLKFRRQQPIDNYIADFVCLKKRIIIEVDGGQHSVEKDKDREEIIILRNKDL